ncbi:MAG: tyrosine-type recombinase/integrase, partial [Planctomycetota bacterium]|nr:tyrosine-type recombinase/integrase [Planctomycetota bacterium]
LALSKIVDDLVKSGKRGQKPQESTHRALQTLAPEIQRRLIDLHLAESSWFAALSQGERLSAWLDEYENWLRSSRTRTGFLRNKDHVQTVMHRIRSIVDGCDFRTWGDIRKSAVETYLGGLSVSLRTHVGYIAAIKAFCTWAVDDERADYSPLQKLRRITVPDREARRPLSADEVGRLLAATVNQPKRYGMSGFDRAVLYRLAFETGFRRNELRHIRPADIDLSKAVVRLAAEHCKDRRDAVQPITMALAASLAGYLADRGPTDRVFVLRTEHTARMIQLDATAAGLPIVDAEGRQLVFHSTRHTLRTELERARVSDGVIDSIMRHKPGGVGKRFYRHVHDFERREAIERLPEYPWPGALLAQAKKAVS